MAIAHRGVRVCMVAHPRAYVYACMLAIGSVEGGWPLQKPIVGQKKLGRNKLFVCRIFL